MGIHATTVGLDTAQTEVHKFVKENLKNDMSVVDKYESISSFIDKQFVGGRYTYTTYHKLDVFWRIALGIDEQPGYVDEDYENDIEGYIYDIQIPLLEEMGCYVDNEQIISSGRKEKIAMSYVLDSKSTIEAEQKLRRIKMDIADMDARSKQWMETIGNKLLKEMKKEKEEATVNV